MARQTIPRFDLYAELGVEPSADDGAIESAYHTQIDRHLPNLDAAATRSRVARLNTARDWLSDSELRNRYDASRARSVARSSAATPGSRRAASSKAGATSRKPAGRRAKAAAGEGAGATAAGIAGGATATAAAIALTPAEAAEAEARAAAEAEAEAGATTTHRELSRSDFAWPAADLDRAATPVAAPRRSSRRMLRGVAGLAALIVVVALVVLAISLLPPGTPVAVASPTAPPPTATEIAPTPSPSPEPTITVTAPPATPAGPDFTAMRQAAWNTIQALKQAAAAGDVATAQTMLGETAPGLRASGLKVATFPDALPADVVITQSGSSYLATAGRDSLTSTDGSTWTFDYADRPLAAYAMPAGIPDRDLYWIESDGRHHIFLRVASATVSKSGVTADFTWHYAADRPDDATYFRRAKLLISSVSLDGTTINVTAAALPMRGLTTLTSTATFTSAGTVPDILEIGITVTNPRTAGGPARAIETVFRLEGR